MPTSVLKYCRPHSNSCWQSYSCGGPSSVLQAIFTNFIFQLPCCVIREEFQGGEWQHCQCLKLTPYCAFITLPGHIWITHCRKEMPWLSGVRYGVPYSPSPSSPSHGWASLQHHVLHAPHLTPHFLEQPPHCLSAVLLPTWLHPTHSCQNHLPRNPLTS